MQYLTHTHLKPLSIIEQQFQTQLVKKIGLNQGVIVLPTGTGKTIVCLLVLLNHIDNNKKRILMVAPTVVLVEQHFTLFNKLLNFPIHILKASDNSRIQFLNTSTQHIVVSTPHIISNELTKDQNFYQHFDILVIDEVHNVSDSYPYLNLRSSFKFILGLTASPGHNKTKINELLKLIHVKQIFTVNLNRFSQIFTVIIKTPKPLLNILSGLQEIITYYTTILKQYDKTYIFHSPFTFQKYLLDNCRTEPVFFGLLKINTYVIRLKHLKYLLGTQDVRMAVDYLNRNLKKPFCHTTQLDKFLDLKTEIIGLDVKNYKIKEIKKLVDENPTAKIIIFTQFRFVANLVKQQITNSALLVGQRLGFTRKNQQKTIENFKQGLTNVLITTSIGEEGLDMPVVDFVVFYEVVADAKRNIQRKGRTGRYNQAIGRVYYLINEKTEDELNYELVTKREENMYSVLDEFGTE